MTTRRQWKGGGYSLFVSQVALQDDFMIPLDTLIPLVCCKPALDQ